MKYSAQRSGESTQSYIQDILVLCQEDNTSISEDEKMSHLMKGFTENIYQTLLKKEISTTADFIKWCNYINDIKWKRIGRQLYGCHELRRRSLSGLLILY
ncbi:retrotrans_gag domain-containing protein [Nephila pilipes]|uniref:Retrotrans_gag domain-containing protein n=1 Tax=Nephila pilipes TaxID=299642 RepID=A0A8X6N6E5_NEPPI|nr:retrotrans_gag domain-containing protein [Nephila pilipes]